MSDAIGAEARRPARDERWVATQARARRFGEVLAAASKSPTTVVGAVIIVILIAMALFAPLLIQANRPDAYQMPRDWQQINAPPGTDGHLLGTTAQGGDVLYGVVWGARTSLCLAFIVVTVTVLGPRLITTESPTATVSTADPTASTTPVASVPTIQGEMIVTPGRPSTSHRSR
jgi:ABC-type antimicrobial peptide transport system permease subunit